MALTPTVLLATSGMANGSGLGINPDMIVTMAAVSSNPLVATLSNLNVNSSSVAGLATTLATLPSFLVTAGNVAANVTAQASQIAPAASGGDPASGIKSLIGLHGSAAGGASSMAEFSAALQNFGSKSFADMGVHSAGFADVITNGATAMNPVMNKLGSLSSQLPLGSLGQLPGGLSGLSVSTPSLGGAGSLGAKLGSLIPAGASPAGITADVPSYQKASQLLGAAQGIGSQLNGLTAGLNSASPSIVAGLGAKIGGLASSFSGVGQLLDPTALAKGQAVLKSESVNAGMADIGKGVKSYGSLFDFSAMELTAVGMLKSLQKQGLAESLGINATIDAYGADPANPDDVPPAVVMAALENVTGDDLKKLISQTGVTLVKDPTTAADLLDPNYVMPPGAVAMLGLRPGSHGLLDLGNSLTNLGVQGDNAKIGAYVESLKVKATAFLDQVKELVPQSVKDTLGPMTGTRSGLFGNPTMSEMIGTAAGATHKDSFDKINTTLSSILNSPVGQQLYKTAQALVTAIFTTGVTTQYTDFQTAVTNFNSTAASNSDLKTAVTTAQTALTDSQSHLAKEVSNLSLAGINLASLPAAPSGVGSIMNMAHKLHDYGVDKQQIGHNELFSGLATNDLTGDAIIASLQEGKNLAKSYALGLPTPMVHNDSAAVAAAQINASAYANTPDSSLTYTGQDNIVWDRIEQERSRRGLPSLASLGYPRPPDQPATAGTTFKSSISQVTNL